MTETEWQACKDPKKMFHWLLQCTGNLSRRKARLFLCGFCRTLRNWEKDDRSRAAVEVSERFADGHVRKEEFQNARNEARKACEDADLFAVTIGVVALDAKWSMGRVFAGGLTTPDIEENKYQVLRDLFGPLPFRSLAIDQSLQTSEVLALASSIYRQRSFDRLPELAQALESAGCTDPDLLEHLRSPGPHCLGCWGLDLVLGKS